MTEKKLENREKEAFALVTGASQGLGKAFALKLAQQKRNLILLSLPDDGLQEVVATLKSYGIKVISYTADLTKKEEIIQFSDWVNRQFDIFLLINNAGIGGHNFFIKSGLDHFDKMIQLNVRAVVLLTRLLLPNLLKQQKAYVLNISSLAAFSPIAYKTIYPASKTFIHSLTLSLREEYKHTNVNFVIVHPGPMNTNGNIKDRLKKQGWFVKLLLMTPDRVATLSLKKLFRGHRTIRLDWTHHLGLALLWVLPTYITIKILSKIAKNEVD